jgi:hypothetical protein
MPKAASQTAGRVAEAGMTGAAASIRSAKGPAATCRSWIRAAMAAIWRSQTSGSAGVTSGRPARQARHEDGRVPVRFAAVRVSGYRLGCRKPGVMNGTKCRGLVPDQRRRVALYEGEDASIRRSWRC